MAGGASAHAQRPEVVHGATARTNLVLTRVSRRQQGQVVGQHEELTGPLDPLLGQEGHIWVGKNLDYPRDQLAGRLIVHPEHPPRPSHDRGAGMDEAIDSGGSSTGVCLIAKSHGADVVNLLEERVRV